MSTNGNTALVSYDFPPQLAPVPARNVSGTVKVGVIGSGYWGLNVVRNLQTTPGAEISAVCDKSSAARKKVHKNYPQLYVPADAAEVLTSPEIDAVAIVTPVWTHYELAKAALENGKHGFSTKTCLPFSSA